MNITESLERVAAWTWQTSWQASVLVVLVLSVQWLFRKKLAPNWRYGLWLLVVVRLILPAAPETSLSVFNWVGVAPAAEAISAFPALPTRVNGSEKPNRQANLAVDSSAPQTSELEKAATGFPGVRPTPAFSAKAIVSLIWLAGAALLSALLIWQYWRFKRRLIDSVPVQDHRVLQILGEIRDTLGLKRAPALLETHHVDSPALFGFLGIRLLLPRGLAATLSSHELRHVLLHEAAHLKRGDMPLNWLITLLQVVHWFNPVLWLGFARLRADREIACDALALSHANEGEGRSYAQTIIKLLEGCARPKTLPGLVGILEDKNQMKRRISMIAKYTDPTRWSVLALLLVMMLGVLALTDAQVGEEGKAVSGAQRNTESQAAVSANDPNSPSQPPPSAQVVVTDKAPSSFGMTLRRLISPKSPVLFATDKVSPDGRYILLRVGEEGELSLYEIASRTTHRFAKADGGASFSGDSTRVALIQGKQLQTTALDGSNPKTIFRGDKLKSIRLYTWSPDGRWFAVEIEKESGKYELALVNAADGTLRVLKSTGTSEVGRVGFSPDSRFLIFDLPADKDRENHDLYGIALESGQETALVVHQSNDRLLGWVPSSNYILFTSDRRGTHDAWAIRFAQGKPEGVPLLIKTDLGRAHALGFTRSGAFYFSLTPYSQDVYTVAMDAKSGKAKGPPVIAVERFEGSNGSPDWSPDGRYLAFSSARSPAVLCVLDTENHQERVIGEGLYGPKWSPDGRSLFAFPSRDTIYKIDVATGNRVVAVPAVPGRTLYGRCEWSRDGKAIYYQYEGGANEAPIVRRDLESGNEQVIHQRGAYYFALSPDGRFIAIRGPSNSELRLIPATGGEPKLLTRFGQGHYIPGWDTFTWSADSRHIFVCKWLFNAQADDLAGTFKSELVRVPLDGGDPETLLVMPGVRQPAAHPDGSRISFAAGGPRSPEIWVMEDFLPNDKVSSN